MAGRQIGIAMAGGGEARGYLTGEGARTGVILYMDAFGPRPSLYGMADRLAAAGHAVLVPDLFWRQVPYGPFAAATAFDVPEERAKLMALIGGTSQAMTAEDTGAFLAALEAAGVTGPIGTVGYCMGGGRALTAAAAHPGRVKAAASLHGGNLASEAADSPHLRAGEMRARLYIGIADEDRSFPPAQAGRLAEALSAAQRDYTMEYYPGCAHGWCVPDHRVYDEAGAERHWRRLVPFMAEALG